MKQASRVGDCPLSVGFGPVLICFLGLLTQPLLLAEAGDTSAQARAILDQMSLATQTLNYEGTFVYIRGSYVTTMRVIHKGDTNGEQERLISLSGSAREVIRNNGEVTCIFPDDRAIMVGKSHTRQLRASALPQPVEKSADYYTFSILGGDRIAGRPTWVVGIQPKKGDRYGYRLWIDTSTHLLLKSNVIDATGTVLEQVVFTNIDILPQISNDTLKPSISRRGYTWYTNKPHTVAAPDAKETKWQVRWLPQGFFMQYHEIHSMAVSPEPVSHMVFSDGLATVSVFVEKLKEKSVLLLGFSSLGAMNTYSTAIHGYQVTVVGEVPATTVRQIAASVTTLQRAAHD